MFSLRIIALSGVLLACFGILSADEKKDPEKRGGTIVGVITAKDKAWLEVKADGEEKPRRYVPHWVGGAPSAGGGPDKKVLEVIAGLKVGSRIKLKWEFEERPRVVAVEVLKAPEGKDK